MTEAQARKTANVVLGIAAAGAAYYILRTPQLRRMAFQLAMAALTGTVPAWLTAEVKRAWTESDRPPEAGRYGRGAEEGTQLRHARSAGH